VAINVQGRVSEDVHRRPEWPKDAARLSFTLRRLAPSLRSEGINVGFDLPDRQQKRQNELVDGLTHQQFIEKMRQRNGEEWFRENKFGCAVCVIGVTQLDG